MEAARLSRALEVTVLSAENLRVDRNPGMNNVYVVVWAESINSFATSMASASEGSGSHFSWNDKFLVDVPKHARSITFEVKSKTAMGVAKNVGVARIAVSDLLGGGNGSLPENCSQLFSYRLRDWEGRPNGVINFAIKIPKYSSPSVVKTAAVTAEKVSSCGFQVRASLGERSCSGVVVGVPIWWNNYTRSHF